MAILKYNGVVLPMTSNQSFRQDNVYDETGHVDPTLVRVDIDSLAVINLAYLPLLAPDLVNNANVTTPADVMAAIAARLRQPRKELLYTNNSGVSLLPKLPTGNQGTCDAKNGPMPRGISYQSLTETTYLLRFGLTAHYHEDLLNGKLNVDADGNPKPGSPVLSNRWTDAVEIDRFNRTRYTREGVFILRTDNPDALTADDLREKMACLGIGPKFIRVDHHYTMSPDGTALRYRVVDEEQFRMPPCPVYEARGFYTESSTNQGGMRYGEVIVHFRGTLAPPGVSPDEMQYRLIRAALYAATNKLRIAGAKEGNFGNVKGFANITSFSCRVNMFENEVELRVGCLLNDLTPRFQNKNFFGIDLRSIVKAPDNVAASQTPDKAPVQCLRGTAGLILKAAAYWDAALKDIKLDNRNPKNFNNVNSDRPKPGEAGKVQEPDW